MVWFLIWLVGFLVIFFAPMALGEVDFVQDKYNDGMTKLLLLAVFWPIVLVACIIVVGWEGLGRGLTWCYIYPTKKMADFWERRKANKV